MSERTLIFCDECGVERGTENHWFSAWSSQPGVRFEPYRSGAVKDIDLCGRECAQKVLERWLDTGSILKPETGERV